MDSLQLLAEGFTVALQPANILWAFLGVLLRTVVGILPGIGPALTVALLLPVTYGLPPVAAFIMFAGIYYGAMYGGSTTSILMNTPGESGSIITALEGNRMARAGRASAALATTCSLRAGCSRASACAKTNAASRYPLHVHISSITYFSSG